MFYKLHMKFLIITLTILLFSDNLHSEDRDMVSLANADLQQAGEKLKTLSEKLEKFQSRYKGDMIVTATAYCNDPVCINVPAWNDGLTKLGTIADMDTVAVDPKYIKLGSILFIEGIGWRLAEDIGSKILKNKIDVFMGDIKKAKQFGKKKVRVKVYG